MGHFDGFAQFPVCFAIELVRFEEEGALVVVGVQHDHVGGDAVSSLHFDDVAHAQVFAFDALVAVGTYDVVLFGVGLRGDHLTCISLL